MAHAVSTATMTDRTASAEPCIRPAQPPTLPNQSCEIMAASSGFGANELLRARRSRAGRLEHTVVALLLVGQFRHREVQRRHVHRDQQQREREHPERDPLFAFGLDTVLDGIQSLINRRSS